MRRPMTRHKGAERFRKQSTRMLQNMATSAGARDGMRWQEYAAAVRAQSAAGIARMNELAAQREAGG